MPTTPFSRDVSDNSEDSQRNLRVFVGAWTNPERDQVALEIESTYRGETDRAAIGLTPDQARRLARWLVIAAAHCDILLSGED